MESKTGHRKAVSTMTQQFRYVGGHIEVFAENGEFLFSADTMQEASIRNRRHGFLLGFVISVQVLTFGLSLWMATINGCIMLQQEVV